MDVTTEYRQCIRTAKARASVVKAVQDIAAHYGAKVTESPYQDAGKERRLEISFGAYGCHISLQGDSRNTAFVVPWFMDGAGEYPPSFASVPGVRSINDLHKRKATGVVYAFGGLCLMLTEAFEMLSPIVRIEAAHAEMMGMRDQRDTEEYAVASKAREVAYRDLRAIAGLPRNFAA